VLKYNGSIWTQSDTIYEVSQNVGIGKEVPTAKLHIYEANGTSASATNGTIFIDKGDSQSSQSIVFKSNMSNNDYGAIEYLDGYSNVERGILRLIVQNDADTGNIRDQIRFNNGGTDMMTIGGAGIGIGEDNPAYPLHIHESGSGTAATGLNGTIVLSHGDSGGRNSITFRSARNAGNDYGAIEYDDGDGSNELGILRLIAENDGNGDYEDQIRIKIAGSDRVRFASNGVSINTSSDPIYTLDVGGSSRFSNIVVGSALFTSWYGIATTGNYTSNDFALIQEHVTNGRTIINSGTGIYFRISGSPFFSGGGGLMTITSGGISINDNLLINGTAGTLYQILRSNGPGSGSTLAPSWTTLTNGTGVTITHSSTDTTFSIGQSVATTDDVTFNSVTTNSIKGQNNGALEFITVTNSVETPRMLLSNGGQLGIGTVPSYDLDVIGDIQLGGHLLVDNYILNKTLVASYTTHYGLRIRSNGEIRINSSQSQDIEFRYENNVLGKWKHTGELGIGTSTPQSLLEVNGTADFKNTGGASLLSITSNNSVNLTAPLQLNGAYGSVNQILRSNNTSTPSWATISQGTGISITHNATDIFFSFNSSSVPTLRGLNLKADAFSFPADPVLTFQNNTGLVADIANITAYLNSSSGGDLVFSTAQVTSGTMTERLRINSYGAIGLAGSSSSNYGTPGQVLTTNGQGGAVYWSTASGGSTYSGTGGISVDNNTNTIETDGSGHAHFGKLHVNYVNSSATSLFTIENTDGSRMDYGTSGNIQVFSPESSSATVRLGAAWSLPGLYVNDHAYIMTPASKNIYFGNHGSTKGYISYDGQLIFNSYTSLNGTSAQFGYNSDTYTVSGRSYSGYCGHTDYAAFGHIDLRTTSGYAILQGAAGDTFVNATGSGSSIFFRYNNSDYAKIFYDRKFEIYGYLQVRGDQYPINGTYLHCMFSSPTGYDWWSIRTSNKNSGDGIDDHGSENRGDLFIVTNIIKSNGEYYEGVFLRNVDSTSRLNFTGQHRVIMNINLQEEIGLIVSSSGKYINIDASTKTNVNEALPTCVLSNVKKDKRVFGIISNKEDTSMSRTYDQGNIQQLGTKKFNNERRFIINSLGEGSVWVTNTNGILQNGDYITTSVIPGYGELQDEDVLKNYTVAKITCDCNFNTELKPNKTVRISIKKWIQEKKIWQNVIHEEEKTRNVFNQDLGRWIQEKYTETKEIQEQVFDEYDLYDEEGNVIDTHKVERVEYIEKEEYEIIYDENGDVILDDELDSDGNIVFDYEYPTRFLNENGQQITHEVYTEMLNNGQPVYIACFVGCTYHCG